METRIGTEKDIQTAGALLLNGELVGFPTETVYGLGANALDPDAVRKIYIAKGRPSDNPLIVHLASLDDLPKVAREIPPIAEELIARFCPGPLTIILKKQPFIPREVTAGLDTVGVRFPAHPMARALIEASCPIAAPSANVSKHVSPTTAEHVYKDLQGRIPLILDGGPCAVGIESTILDLTSDIPTILRPGAITKEMISEVCMVMQHQGEVKIALAPGMKYIHYTPRCDCTMTPPEELRNAYHTAVTEGIKAVVLARHRTLMGIGDVCAIDLGDTDEEVMRNLYASLRDAEERYGLIILEQLPEEGMLYSVMNRAKKSVNKK